MDKYFCTFFFFAEFYATKKFKNNINLNKTKETQYQCRAGPLASAQRLPSDRCKVAL
jgi:hypothetical protein